MGSCGGSFCTAGVNDDPCKALFLVLEQRMNRSKGPRSTTDDFAVALPKRSGYEQQKLLRYFAVTPIEIRVSYT